MAGAFIGGVSDIIGQEVSNISHGRSLTCVNVSEAIGATVGGALGGSLSQGAEKAGVSQLEASWSGTSLGTVGAGVGHFIGIAIGF